MNAKLSAVVLGSLISMSGVYAADAPATQPTTQPTQAPAAAVTPAVKDRIAAGVTASINLIKAASEPSAAIDAYAIGMSIDPDSKELREAYVKKMAELGTPDLAFTQAQQALNENSSNPVAKSVLAMGQARRGDLSSAMSQITAAAKQSPDDPIVQRTFAQLLVLYDRQITKPVLSDATKNDIENLRRSMSNKQGFADAYKQALDYYAKAPTQSPTTPAAANDQMPPINTYGASTTTYRYDYVYDTPAYVPSAVQRYAYVGDYLPTPAYYLYSPYWAYNRGSFYCPPDYFDRGSRFSHDRWRNRSDFTNRVPVTTVNPPQQTVTRQRMAPIRTPDQIWQERNVPIRPNPGVNPPGRRPVGPMIDPPAKGAPTPSSGQNISNGRRSTR